MSCSSSSNGGKCQEQYISLVSMQMMIIIMISLWSGLTHSHGWRCCGPVWSWSSSLCEIIIVINAITFINIYALIGNSPSEPPLCNVARLSSLSVVVPPPLNLQSLLIPSTTRGTSVIQSTDEAGIEFRVVNFNKFPLHILWPFNSRVII